MTGLVPVELFFQECQQLRQSHAVDDRQDDTDSDLEDHISKYQGVGVIPVKL